MEGAPSSEKNILVPLFDRLAELIPFVPSRASVWEAVGKVVGLLAKVEREAECPGRSWTVSAKLSRMWLWQRLCFEEEEGFECTLICPELGFYEQLMKISQEKATAWERV